MLKNDTIPPTICNIDHKNIKLKRKYSYYLLNLHHQLTEDDQNRHIGKYLLSKVKKRAIITRTKKTQLFFITFIRKGIIPI